jgi:hypothetical protein
MPCSTPFDEPIRPRGGGRLSTLRADEVRRVGGWLRQAAIGGGKCAGQYPAPRVVCGGQIRNAANDKVAFHDVDVVTLVAEALEIRANSTVVLLL